MGQDKPGKYHPPSGKPSGANKSEGLGVASTSPEKMEEYFEITDRYVDEDKEQTSAAAKMTHPNRNTSKHEEVRKSREVHAEPERNKSDSITQNIGNTEPLEITELNRAVFLDLASYRSPHCVSLYMQTHESGSEVNDGIDKLNFKNVIQELAAKLENQGADEIQIQRLLRPAFELNQDNLFWKKLKAGLALFIAEGFFQYAKLPYSPVNEVVCGNSFCVAPLIDVVVNTEDFYLLTISKHRTRLFRGNRYRLEPVEVTDLPASVDVITDTAHKNSSVFRTGGRGGTGGANFHGIGGENDHKQEIASYLEMADDQIYKQVLHDKNAPLLLAGVEYLIPIYRSVADYRNICAEALTGNHDDTDPRTLHQLAAPLMQGYFSKRLTRALESYRNSINTPLVSSMPETVISASCYGRVDTLFVKKGMHLWGRFDQQDNQFEWHNEQRPSSDDLVATAVRHTLLNGGDVFQVEENELPWNDAELAAILRY